MDYLFRAAGERDVEAVFSLYQQRVAWMEQTGIRQWNVTDYLAEYPAGYYRAQQEQGNLYVLRGGSEAMIAGAVVLLRRDSRWEDRAGDPALYIHNLVTAPDCKGAGRCLLDYVEALARGEGKRFLRLDCAEDNHFLNRYYEALGYLPAGGCREGSYVGIRREKVLCHGEDNRRQDGKRNA